MNPRETKNAITISHITRSPKPLTDCSTVSVPVRLVAVSPNTATTPIGNGLVMMPTMVAMKMASRCQAWISTPSGGGVNHTTTPTASVPASRSDLFRFKAMGGRRPVPRGRRVNSGSGGGPYRGNAWSGGGASPASGVRAVFITIARSE